MDSGLIEVVPHEATYSSPGIALGPPGRALAGDWSAVAGQPWQHILDETIVELAWSAGSEELDALIDAVVECATSRQRSLSARTLAGWVRATLADRELFRCYVHDPAIPAERRAALARDLGASSRRIEALVSALLGSMDGEPALAAGAASGLTLDDPDPASIELALRAQASTIERRLNELLQRMARLDRPLAAT